MRTLTRRLLGVGVALSVVAGGAGVAYAAGWITFGSTTLYTGTASIQPLSVWANVTSEQPLYPGGRINADVTIENGNTAPVTITAIEATSITIDDAHEVAGCDSGYYSFQAPSLDSLPQLGAATWGDDTDRVTVTGAMALSGEAPLACQGASVTVHLRATGEVGSSDDDAAAGAVG